MKENKYDDNLFFNQYSQMSRSVEGLKGAGEWYILQKMLPDFTNKRVLDLGCGFGWHCIYAIEHGAKFVTGVDISKKMLEEAKKRNSSPQIEYKRMAIEDFDFQPDTYDVVISSLTFHYLESFIDICRKISTCLTSGGSFVFSVEHPIFTAYGSQDWFYDQEGKLAHWPVDRYFSEEKRTAFFLGEEVIKYHKTLTTYINSLLQTGFEICELIEPQPDKVMLDSIPEMKEELRRPMMLLISAKKKN
ncbi:bifunctional 2-polyprenyl-6-hydroxyphenol methylase/3-demethylubiquinol 3-O-methyltransferase UbiG [Bacteroides sp.]|uniref:class I SAM-dependent methyltransferase n=1 Tax=Bacteroides sp. TaxID=29523 RepID=UPI0026302962|nr:class I SAM-dependent methyltransferase [Bacteroides sp.]MDD3038588.1 class I SAM-dependent methyltransferase [Bacteroides sp.]